MKSNRSICLITLLACLVSGLTAMNTSAQEVQNEDKTLSPFFYVQSDDPTLDQLPLKSCEVDSQIAGVMAAVSVKQTYANEGTRPIEAIYVFPASTRAAVHAMSMRIGDRLIEAEIREKKQAQKEYDEAKDEGKSVTLLEQQRPNVFQMSVANIMPGDVIVVELHYVELLVPEDGTYEFVYPTVVGPRYSETPAEGSHDSEGYIETPYTHEGEDSLFDYNITASISSGIPIKSVTSVMHDINVQYETPYQADIILNATEKAGTKDYILRYNLQDDVIQSGVLLYRHEDENFFLVMVEPPDQITESIIPPRDYNFVLDVSGSMSGYPLNTAKQLIFGLLEELRPTDYFNVLTFAGGSMVLYDSSVPATPANINDAITRIGNLYGGGGTRLLPALERTFNLPHQSEDIARSTVVITDGYVTVEYEAFDLIRNKLNLSNLFALGIGTSVNRFIIEGMAYAGRGEPFFITNPGEVDENITKFQKYIQNPVLSQIEINFSDLEVYDIEPPAIPDLFTQRPIIAFGKYIGEPTGSITVSGFTGNGPFEQTYELSPELENESNKALRYLWARHRIKTLSDYDAKTNYDYGAMGFPDNASAVIELGLKYNMLTNYTSFIAVDYIIRNEGGEGETIKQPVPLPDGVSDYAVGEPPQNQDNDPGMSVPVNDWSIHENTGDVLIPGPGIIPSSIKCTILNVMEDGLIKIIINGKEETVRLVDIEFPVENKAVYSELIKFLQKWLQGKEIYVEFVDTDKSINNKQVYLFINQRNINVKLVELGYAVYIQSSKDTTYLEEFKSAQESAQTAKIGIWQ